MSCTEMLEYISCDAVAALKHYKVYETQYVVYMQDRTQTQGQGTAY